MLKTRSIVSPLSLRPPCLAALCAVSVIESPFPDPTCDPASATCLGDLPVSLLLLLRQMVLLLFPILLVLLLLLFFCLGPAPSFPSRCRADCGQPTG